MVSESQLQQQVADYLRLQYPDALFHSDFGSSVRMSVKQGALKKRQNGGRRGWPDMEIPEPRIDECVYSTDYEPPFFFPRNPGVYIGGSELGDEK